MNKMILLYLISAILIVFGILGALISSNSFIVITQIVLGLILFVTALVNSRFSIVRGAIQNISQVLSTKKLLRLLANLSLLSLLVLINYLAFHSTFRIDLTEQKIFSLSSETRKTLLNLDKKVEIIALAPLKPNERQKVIELLKLFTEANPSLIETNLLDPQSNPQLASQLKLAKHEKVVLQSEAKESRIASYEEGDLLRAITRLANQESTTVYYLSGHSEASLYSDTPDGLAKFRQVIENEVGSIKNLFLSETSRVPDDAKMLVLNLTKQLLAKSELQAIDDYLYQGGHLLVFMEPNSSDISEILSSRGIGISKAAIIDQVQKVFGTTSATFQITTKSFGNSPILNNFTDTDLLSFSYATPLSLDPDFVKAKLVTGLVFTTSSAWGETQSLDLNTNELVVEKSAEDIQGPLVIGASFQGLKNKLGKRTKIIAFGDVSWVTNQYIDMYANNKLASQSISWLSSEHQPTIAPRTYRKSIILLSQSEISNMLVLSLILPQILLILGICVWWWRSATSVTA